MRKLQTIYFFAFTRIIKKMGIREELKSIAKNIAKIQPSIGEMTEEKRAEELLKMKEIATNEMQVELIMIFVENVGNAESEVYKFISNISEKSIEELKDFTIFMESIQAIFEDETIKSFFSLALK